MATVSLCMIVKDEADFLPACLKSVHDLVDEAIVVDTGSTDGSPDIARKHGAIVHFHPWEGDFSAARNAALAHASSDFVLILDADEQLAPGASQAIRRALGRAAFDGALLPLHNASTLDATPDDILGGRQRMGDPVLLPRLFRRTRDLRYEGAVHESPRTWSLTPGRRIIRIDAPILHFGYVPSVYDQRDKALRNRRLLEQRCSTHPHDPDARTYLAEELEHEGDRDAALQMAQRAWSDLKALAPAEQKRPIAMLLATILVRLYVRRSSFEHALEAIGEARNIGFDHPNLDFLEARSLEIRSQGQPPGEDLDRADALYRQCLRADRRDNTTKALDGVYDVSSWLRLGIVSCRRGDDQTAARAFQLVLERNPADVDARLGLAETHLADDRPGQALGIVQPLLEAHGADAWILGAAASWMLGQPQETLMCVRQAVSRVPSGLREPHRMDTLQALGRALREASNA